MEKIVSIDMVVARVKFSAIG